MSCDFEVKWRRVSAGSTNWWASCSASPGSCQLKLSLGSLIEDWSSVKCKSPLTPRLCQLPRPLYPVSSSTNELHRKPLSYLLNEKRHNKIPFTIVKATVNRRKLSWFGHICRHDTLPKILQQGTVDGSRRRGRLRKSRRGQHYGIDRPIDVVIVAHRRR